MESYEVIKQAVDRVGAKQVAAALNVSTSLVYKWCEKPPEDEDEYASGARNPLDRILALLECTGDHELPSWICQQGDGFFVPNPPAVGDGAIVSEFVSHTQRMIQDFSELLGVMSDSIAHEDRIDGQEAQLIRREWQRLKQYGERFVCACERGLFDKAPERKGK